ncbi:MAG: hypothetical protein GHCLOJNM_03853 [bacterium]|nr:hypothetical protein [bacterium]
MIRNRGFHLVPVCFGLMLSLAASVKARECPYEGFPDGVLAGFSMESWDAYARLYGADKLAETLHQTLVEEVAPAILKVAEATGPIQDLPSKLEELRDKVDWEFVGKCGIAVGISLGKENLPTFTLRLSAPSGEGERLFSALAGGVAHIASAATAELSWKVEGNSGALRLALGAQGEEATSEVKAPVLLSLVRREDQVWVRPMGASDTAEQSSPCADPAIGSLWEKLPEPCVATALVDLSGIARHLNELIDFLESEEKWESSLILDPTLESLFTEDVETLEKLREVEKDFDSMTPTVESGVAKVLRRLVEILGDQGCVVAGLGPQGTAVQSTTLWQPRAGGAHADLFKCEPLSSRFLGFLSTSWKEVSVFSLPDLARIHRLIVDLLKELPDSEESFRTLDELEKEYEFSIERDLIPAFGREGVYVTRAKPKGTPAFQLSASGFQLALAIGDVSAARRTVAALERLLASGGMVGSASFVGDMTCSVLDAGLMGKASWILLEEARVFMFTSGDSRDQILEFVDLLKNPRAATLAEHPDWGALSAIWSKQPTDVSLIDVSQIWKEAEEDIKGARMMLSMMGEVGTVAVPMLQLVLRAMQALEAPSWGFTVASDEGELRISKTLLLYPSEQ